MRVAVPYSIHYTLFFFSHYCCSLMRLWRIVLQHLFNYTPIVPVLNIPDCLVFNFVFCRRTHNVQVYFCIHIQCLFIYLCTILKICIIKSSWVMMVAFLLCLRYKFLWHNIFSWKIARANKSRRINKCKSTQCVLYPVVNAW